MHLLFCVTVTLGIKNFELLVPLYQYMCLDMYTNYTATELCLNIFCGVGARILKF